MRRKSLSDKIRESGPLLDEGRPPAIALAPPAPAVEAAPGPDAGDIHRRAMAYVGEAMARVRAREPLSMDQGIALVGEVVAACDAGEDLFSLALHQENGEDFQARHGANVAVFMARLTGDMGLSRENRLLPCAAGLFHDLGRALLPESLLNKPGPISEKERKEVHRCPEFSRDLLAQYAPDLPVLAKCALEAYERADGSGYPKGKKCGEIHEFACVLGLADLFEALIHTRPHRSRFLHHTAAREVLRTGKRLFDPWLMKAFLRTFTLFPLHSCVRLNSGAMGRVVATRPEHPLRPAVRILLNCEGERPREENVVDLTLEPLLFVTEAVQCPEQP